MSNIFFNISIDTISFGKHVVLKEIELPLYEREIVTIVGPSGIGKTQLLKWVQRNYQSSLSPGLVFQGQSLFPWLTLKENLLISLHSSVGKDDVDKILVNFNLDEFANHFPSEVSGGMAQKINIARAMLWPSNLILLDEPFTGLDYFQKEELKTFALNVIEKLEKTALFVTHDIDEAIDFSDWIHLLNDSPAKIYKSFKGMRLEKDDAKKLQLRTQIREGFRL